MPHQPHPPLKRHESLQPLSRDHYVGLVQAQHLIKSADAGPEARRKALQDFQQAWSSEILPHFTDEERLLPEMMPADAVERLVREHRTLRAMVNEAPALASAQDPDAQRVRTLGQTLNDHIRWEERELFPLIERSASPQSLESLWQETAEIERTRPRAIRRTRL